MFKYKLKNTESALWDSIVDTVLFNLGLNQYKAMQMVNAPKYVEVDKSESYNNLELGFDLFRKHLNNNSTFGILVDCDCDGYLSSSMLYDFLINELKVDENRVKYYIHSGKIHGLEDEEVFENIANDNIDLMLIADASSSERTFHEKLNAKNTDILVLDHHEFNINDIVNNNKTIIINNQANNDVNKYLSGTGVTYKFVNYAYKKLLNKDLGNKYIDLVALSLISDVMDLSELGENWNYLILGTLKENITNKLISCFMETLNKEYLNFNDIAFGISSSINAIVRVGDLDDKEMLFKALCNSNETVKYSQRAKPTINQSIQEATLRVANNKKSKQKREIDKIMEGIEVKILKKDLFKNKVLIVDVSEFNLKSFGGIIATKLSSQYKRPTILVSNIEGNTYGGSCRGYEKSNISDFKKICEDTNLFNWCKGHSNAFGCNIEIENLIKVNDIFNSKFENEENEDIYLVDKVFEGSINKNDLKDIADLDRL